MKRFTLILSLKLTTMLLHGTGYSAPFAGDALLHYPHYFSFSLFLVVDRYPAAVCNLVDVNPSLQAAYTKYCFR